MDWLISWTERVAANFNVPLRLGLEMAFGWLCLAQAACLAGGRLINLSAAPITGTSSSSDQLGQSDYARPSLVVGLRSVVSELLPTDERRRNLGTSSSLGSSVAVAVWYAWACAGTDWLICVWHPVAAVHTYAWIAVASLAFGLFYGSADFYVYLIPMFISFAIWIGLGVVGLVRQFPQRFSIVGLGPGVLVIVYFVSRSAIQASQVDASHDLRAESFGREVLSVAPPDAIIFAKGDQAVFALWYFHFALHERPDLLVLATDLLHFDWYQENLQAIYPTLVVPDPFPWPETIVQANPLRAICYVQYTDYAEINCSKPLTPP